MKEFEYERQLINRFFINSKKAENDLISAWKCGDLLYVDPLFKLHKTEPTYFIFIIDPRVYDDIIAYIKDFNKMCREYVDRAPLHPSLMKRLYMIYRKDGAAYLDNHMQIHTEYKHAVKVIRVNKYDSFLDFCDRVCDYISYFTYFC